MLALLTSKLGLGAIAVALVLAVIGVQTARLEHAKADQIDPASHQPWRTEAQDRAKALTACQTAKSAAEAATAKANASVALLADAGSESRAKVEQQLAGVAGQVAALRSGVAALKTYQPKGADLCARWNDADAKVRGALQ